MEAGAQAIDDPHRYDAALANRIEARWRERWDTERTFWAPNPSGDLSEPNAELLSRPKYYVLDMFPYPSGDGLHVGHPLGYIATDVYARFKRMSGFNVLHTMGYDAFGLPAERYAIDHGEHPEVTTERNIANMRRQLHMLGLGHDPRRSVSTTDTSFVHWTQWVFLQIYNAWYDAEAERARPISELVEAFASGERVVPGGGDWASLDAAGREAVLAEYRLAYVADAVVNWCPALGTVLANEEVTADGRSEAGNFPVYRRPLRQWMMRITAYADRLLDDLEGLDWSPALKTMQSNWIGRSEGASVRFELPGDQEPLVAFTTRADTLLGVTFIAVAPEHPLLDGALSDTWSDDLPVAWRGPEPSEGPAAACAAYRERAERRSDRQRGTDDEATAVYTGIDAIHPLTGDRVPVFAADYVLADYGTGVVMGVPAHDQRDFGLAQALSLPIRGVVEPSPGWFEEHGLDPGAPAATWPDAYVDSGRSTGAGGALDGRTDGLPNTEAREAIIEALVERGAGDRQISYRLRDWLFSRQRYWGEPIPIVFDEDGTAHPLPPEELPVRLPELEDFAPQVTEDDSDPVPPLARATDWTHVELDLGDGPRRYRRETNTMPQWAGSCWYYLRYIDPADASSFVDPANERYWMGGGEQIGGVDLYVGGVEHAVLHLLYARFWHKILFDLGHVSSPEPFGRLFNQGMVQAAAFTDSRGFYVPAAEVEERDGGFWHAGEPVERQYGKMGKSLKNGVSPDDVVAQSGADALRLYEMFLGPLDQNRPWQTQGIVGMERFLRRVWRLVVDERTGLNVVADVDPSPEVAQLLHRTLGAVRRDLEALHFNTAIAALMELTNEVRAALGDAPTPRLVAEWIVLALAPLAPHISEELWERLGHEGGLAHTAFPEADERLAQRDTVKVAIQVNGKLRGLLTAPRGAGEAELEALARAEDNVVAALEGKTVRRIIVVPERLVNFVVS